jgi:hypothetical protein
MIFTTAGGREASDKYHKTIYQGKNNFSNALKKIRLPGFAPEAGEELRLSGPLGARKR